MAEIRDKAKTRVAELVLSAFVNAKGCQKANTTGVCYPFDMDKCVHCLANIILSIPEIAVVDREAELPEADPEYACFDCDIAQEDMLNEGWVKEVKE